MAISTLIYRLFWSYLTIIYYNILISITLIVNILKNPFSNPWALKLRLEPPKILSDPKYGTHKYMICNNVKLHYVESGDSSKPLMLFIHGFPEFWYSWRHQIVEFNKDYWCVAVDMRGYGDSEKPDNLSAYKVDNLVEDIRDIVRKLGREKCILIAHDWGTIIATKFRDRYPEVLHGIATMGGATLETMTEEIWNNPEQFKMSWYIYFFQMPWLPEKLLTMNDLAFIAKSFTLKDNVLKQEDLDCYKYCFGKPTALTPPINYYRVNLNTSMKRKPKCNLPIPFIHLHGEKDPYLHKNLLNRMKEYYANIETVVLEDCSHHLQQHNPDKVNAVIRQFLKKNNI